MKIKCPECENLLSLGTPKPGSYRPKCKQCGKPFRLKVTEDDPPKIGVGRIRSEAKSSQAKPSPAKKSVAPPASAPSASTNVEATMDSAPGTDATINNATVVEATMDSASAVEATLGSADPDAGQATQVEATMDGSADSAPATVSAGPASVRPGSGGVSAADRTSGNADATMDGTMDGSRKDSASMQTSKAKKSIVSAGASAAKSVAKKASDRSSDLADMPERLGGYRILRLLGKGAMGAVYEAKQISLDRLVALKTIRGRLASNPASLARFTREAYAAAQLTHHNVVQIYDFGEDAGKHFFSMEWVRGGPLDELIRDKGALDPKLAAGYTLQAARGLQFAHRNGMVHRDVKPANLLLTDEGVIKVADLGLVKIPDLADLDTVDDDSSMSGLQSGTQVTMQGTAVGTPAYMAPEQGVDATAVDHRADIYSLGCTLFYMLAGRAPFEGSVVSEVLEQHAKQPLPSLVQINSRVPAALQSIVEKSMAKRAEDRYATLSEMIVDLEAFLGVSADGKFSPTSEQADKWERIAVSFAASTPMMRLTKPAFAGLLALSGLLTVVMPFAGLGWILLGPTLFVAAIAVALILGAGGGQSPIVTNVRAWLGSLSWLDYGIGLVGGVVFLLVVFIAGMWPGVLLGGLLGAAAGAAYHLLLIAPSRKRSYGALQAAERFVRDLRIDGADEEGVRMFVARYAGKKWQGIFEAMFGYESLCKIREQLSSDPSFSGATSANSWRDKICASLSARVKANSELSDHKRLAEIEQRGLQSEGLSASDARDRAWQMAAAVMDNAKAVSPTTVDADTAAQEKRDHMKTMLADARSGKYKKKRDKLAPLRFALGGQTRLLIGCILLAIFAIWGNNNGLFDSLKEIDPGSVDVSELRQGVTATARQTDATTRFLGFTTNAWSIGLAGLLLAMSSFVSGWRMSPFAAVATIVILFGPSFGIPAVGELLQPWMVSGLAGLAVYLPGIMFGEAKEW
jgi:serine/threonine protein kinase